MISFKQVKSCKFIVFLFKFDINYPFFRRRICPSTRSEFPFFRRGGFFLPWQKKDQGSVSNTRQDLFEKTSAIGSQHYPVDLRSPPLLQKGNIRELLADTSPALRATPSAEKDNSDRVQCKIPLLILS